MDWRGVEDLIKWMRRQGVTHVCLHESGDLAELWLDDPQFDPAFADAELSAAIEAADAADPPPAEPGKCRACRTNPIEGIFSTQGLCRACGRSTAGLAGG